MNTEIVTPEDADLPTGPMVLLSQADIATELNLAPQTIRMYRSGRYSSNPPPEPAFVIGKTGPQPVPGWRPEQAADWKAWAGRRPARGAVLTPQRGPEQATEVLLSQADIGDELGLSVHTIRLYRSESDGRYADHPTPPPAVVIGKTNLNPVPGWRPEQVDDWKAWNAKRSGRWPGPTPEEQITAAEAALAQAEQEIAAAKARKAAARKAIAAARKTAQEHGGTR